MSCAAFATRRDRARRAPLPPHVTHGWTRGRWANDHNINRWLDRPDVVQRPNAHASRRGLEDLLGVERPRVDRISAEGEVCAVGQNSRSRRQLGFGAAVGILLVFAIVVPGLTQEPPDGHGSDGREMALALGCDMSQNQVMMEATTLEYGFGSGSSTVEEAVLGASLLLKQSGVDVTDGALREAAADANRKTTPVNVRLPGAILRVVSHADAFVVGEVITCA